MRFLVFGAVILAVAFASKKNQRIESETNDSQGPWQAGQIYRYDIKSYTLASQPGSAATGQALRAQLTIRAKSPGQIQARLDNAEYAQVHDELQNANNQETTDQLPPNLNYQPAQNLENPFEIYVNGGRVVSLKLSASVPLPQENLLKGLISALQADLTTHRNVHSPHDTYDKDIQQGLFRKMESDVTGDCETLYAVSPVAAEWRRELPIFASHEEPIEIRKSKNYGHCHHRVEYHFGVPSGGVWAGTAYQAYKNQLIKRATVSRILVAKNGPIYKAETSSTINVHPYMYGKQNAEVLSKITLDLVSYGQDNEPEWEQPENMREVRNLLYSLTHKPIGKDASSSSSESNENQGYHAKQKTQGRPRRSTRSKSVTINKVVNKRDHHGSKSSSSSSSESAYINDNIPNNNEPAYAALYLNPQPPSNSKQNPTNAQKLIQELAHQLQNANNMPKGDFLSKFNILVRVISSMDANQLNQLQNNMEVTQSDDDHIKSDMQMIYRDAVTQAGTLPAFQQIKSWIQNKKIQGEEAAEVVSAFARTLRYPTKEAMTQFFDLAMSPEVRQQSYLNSTLLIAATKLMNMGQVNNFTANHQYPTHTYGRLANQQDRFVVDNVIPRLEKEMQEAIQQGDSHKSQVYIRAIGNLGHRKILRVFAPYLEGKKPVQTYIRAYMVQNLDYLAVQRDSLARAVLYSIMRNTAEAYEVRAAAIKKVMSSQPSSAMMQTMAKMTNDDPSIQVRAMLKSFIISAAQQENTRFYEMSRTANSVKGLLTRQKFGAQYSGRNMSSKFDDEDNLGIIRLYSNVGSEDSIWPKSLRYTQKNRADGWQKTKTFEVSSTSIRNLIDAVSYGIAQAISNKEPSKEYDNGPNHKYNAKKIAEMLNIQSNEQEPLEGSIYFDAYNQLRLFTFGDMNEVSNTIRAFLNNLSKETSTHYTKVFNQNQVSIMFPLASGMPFIYKYKQPTVLHVRGAAISYFKSVDQKYKTSTNIEGQFTYAQNYDGRVGFLDTLGNRVATVGIVTKLQINLPAKINVQVNSGEFKYNFKPLNKDQDENIMHYSVWPYSANQQKDSLVTISHDPATKSITRARKVVSFDYKIGQQNALHIQGYSYSEDYRNIRNLWKSNNVVDNVMAALRQSDVAQTHYNLKYLGKQSKSKGVSIAAYYDTFYVYNQKQDGQMPADANEQNDVSPNSENRRQELIKRVVSGINTAKAKVLDLSLTYEGPQPQEYAATIAVASSPVDPKIQFAFYAGKSQQSQDQINVAGTYTRPSSTSPLNYAEALKQNMKVSLEADIRIGQKQNIHIKGTGERSKQYTEDLQNYPPSNSCLQQLSNDDNYQSDCVKVITKAHAPNNFRFTVNYKGLSNAARGVSTQIQDIAQKLDIWQAEHDMLRGIAPGGEGSLEINADASYSTNTLNLKLHSQSGEIRVNNIAIPRWSAYALATNSPFKPYENAVNKFTSAQYMPSCAVDGSSIRTFSGRSYAYALSRSWHVVLQNWKPNEQEQIAVLARRPAQNQLEIYISYRAPSGNDFEMQVQPSQDNNQPNVNVQTNANKVSQGDLTTYWDNVQEIPLLQYYTENSGVWIMEIQENRVRVMYDGQRLVVLTDNGRNNTRGICGYMSGEPRDDYFTPSGLVDKPEHYGASYAIDDENSEPETKELQNQAKQAAYQPHRRYTAILRSDAQYNAAMQTSSSSSSSEEKWGSQNVYRSRSYLKQQGQCKVQNQVQYYENYGEICITTRPLAACQSHCSGDKYKIQGAQVVCRPKLDQQFQAYRDQIRQGQNPKVNGVPHTKQYRVPGSCKA